MNITKPSIIAADLADLSTLLRLRRVGETREMTDEEREAAATALSAAMRPTVRKERHANG
jgi:hypothetical protein